MATYQPPSGSDVHLIFMAVPYFIPGTEEVDFHIEGEPAPAPPGLLMGELQVLAVWRGTTRVTAIYRGTTQIFG